jgi:hypothetical protein
VVQSGDTVMAAVTMTPVLLCTDMQLKCEEWSDLLFKHNVGFPLVAAAGQLIWTSGCCRIRFLLSGFFFFYEGGCYQVERGDAGTARG